MASMGAAAGGGEGSRGDNELVGDGGDGGFAVGVVN